MKPVKQRRADRLVDRSSTRVKNFEQVFLISTFTCWNMPYTSGSILFTNFVPVFILFALVCWNMPYTSWPIFFSTVYFFLCFGTVFCP